MSDCKHVVVVDGDKAGLTNDGDWFYEQVFESADEINALISELEKARDRCYGEPVLQSPRDRAVTLCGSIIAYYSRHVSLHPDESRVILLNIFAANIIDEAIDIMCGVPAPTGANHE